MVSWKAINKSQKYLENHSYLKLKKYRKNDLKHLTELTEVHSKSEMIRKEKIEKKAYFTDRRFSKEDVQLLFTLRTKMLDWKSNFSHLHGDDLGYRVCGDENSVLDEEHLQACPELISEGRDVTFTDVHGNIDAQHAVTKVFKEILRW